jgi:hypothetical protein
MVQINDPDVVAELKSLHERYETALVTNDVATLTSFFWDSPHALRFGVGESLYGAAEIEAFRKARSPAGLEREVFSLRIVSFGTDCGIVTLEFHRTVSGGRRDGRQTQVWRKFPNGWKIVSAHVSLVPGAYADQAAAFVGLSLPREYRAGVMQNLERAAAIAMPLLSSALDDEIEAAPVFEP